MATRVCFVLRKLTAAERTYLIRELKFVLFEKDKPHPVTGNILIDYLSDSFQEGKFWHSTQGEIPTLVITKLSKLQSNEKIIYKAGFDVPEIASEYTLEQKLISLFQPVAVPNQSSIILLLSDLLFHVSTKVATRFIQRILRK
jgi:hypothetical protein